jgi:hypothetical protein
VAVNQGLWRRYLAASDKEEPRARDDRTGKGSPSDPSPQISSVSQASRAPGQISLFSFPLYLTRRRLFVSRIALLCFHLYPKMCCVPSMIPPTPLQNILCVTNWSVLCEGYPRRGKADRPMIRGQLPAGPEITQQFGLMSHGRKSVRRRCTCSLTRQHREGPGPESRRRKR